MELKLTGYTDLINRLERMTKATRDKALRDAMTEGAEIVLDDARRRVPVREGDLRSSLEIRPGRKAFVTIGSDLPYAPVIEYGWESHGIAAQPYLRPALEENEGQVKDVILARLNHEMGL